MAQMNLGTTYARPVKKRQGLDYDMLDAFQGMTPDGTLIPTGDTFDMYEAGRRRTQGERAAQRAAEPDVFKRTATIAGPHFSEWDAFFGALNNRADLVKAAGGTMNVDLVGKGPGTGTGIGTWKESVDGGPSYPVEASMAGGSRSRVPGLRSTRPGAGSLGLLDALDPEEARAWIRAGLGDEATAARIANEGAADDLENERMNRALALSQPTPEQNLFRGVTGARARAIGGLEDEATLRQARGTARAFTDPEVAAARQQANQEQEALLQARYGREADAAARIEAARIAAAGRVDSANATSRGALTREAIRGLLKSRELSQLLGGQEPTPEQAAGLEGLLNRYAGAGEGQEEQQVDDASLDAMIAGAKVNDDGKQKLAEWWPALTAAQQAKVSAVFGR